MVKNGKKWLKFLKNHAHFDFSKAKPLEMSFFWNPGFDI
jgi:hypothetical protein